MLLFLLLLLSLCLQLAEINLVDLTLKIKTVLSVLVNFYIFCVKLIPVVLIMRK